MEYNQVYDEKKSFAADWEFVGQVHEVNPHQVFRLIANLRVYLFVCFK